MNLMGYRVWDLENPLRIRGERIVRVVSCAFCAIPDRYTGWEVSVIQQAMPKADRSLIRMIFLTSRPPFQLAAF